MQFVDKTSFSRRPQSLKLDGGCSKLLKIALNDKFFRLALLIPFRMLR